MDTSALKPFAQTMRNDLMTGVRQRMRYWGFTKGADPDEEVEPVEGGYLFRGEVHADTSVPKKWTALRSAVRQHSVDDVVEEAAYTWFNRLLAIRVLEKNGTITDVLAYAPDTHEPALLHRAKQGIFPPMRPEAEERVREALLSGDEDAAFRLLLVAFCHSHDLLNDVFGRLDDYTELLLPTGLLDPDGLLRRLVTTGAITDEDYRQVELIGWMYQFYISEKKDAVYKSKKKFRPEDIPAATQIFTPRWIVRYMVENTLGRLWLDKHPESLLREAMEYLVEPDDYEPQAPIFDELAELQLFDPASGSGHILVVGFDLLMQMYREAGYPDRQAVEQILRHNLKGLDIDRRAAQLARFALLMKAAAYDRGILQRRDVRPEVYAMPEPRRFSDGDLRAYLGDDGFDAAGAEVKEALELLREHGQNVGSALKLELSQAARNMLAERMAHWEAQPEGAMGFGEQELAQALKAYLEPLVMLIDRYPTVAMNPPYMGSGQMNGPLKSYVTKHYPLSKSDLFAVFMEVGEHRSQSLGRLSMINQQSWMFLRSYLDLRRHFIRSKYLDSMIHLGPRAFDEISGEVVQSTVFTVQNASPRGRGGTYFRLVDERSSAAKKEAYHAGNHQYSKVDQENFDKLPSSPIAYWVPDTVIAAFEGNALLGEKSKPRVGLQTGDNARFLRHWPEVSYQTVAFDYRGSTGTKGNAKAWFPYNKGGNKKWYGNLEFVIYWQNNGESIKSFAGSYVRNESYYFKKGISFPKISSSNFTCYMNPPGVMFDNAANSVFPTENNFNTLLSFLNSKVAEYLLNVVNPTVNFQVGDVANLPLADSSGSLSQQISAITGDSLVLAQEDFDSRELSWDFARHPLVQQKVPSLESAHATWRNKAALDFFQLHTNEEDLNQLFIKLYGLQNHLSPYVALNDTTALEVELDRKALTELDAERDMLSYEELRERLPFKVEAPIQQFLSYGIGVMLGRYRLGHDGLHIAHPNATAEEEAPYEVPVPLAAEEPDTSATFEIDRDGILPLMGTDSPFSDDAVHRMREILRLVWGEDTLTDNLNFINRALSEGASRGYARPKEQTMEAWLVDEFWDYHKGLYSVPYYGKKPIYWLFASPKRHFQVLVYMHRMTKYTAQQIRQNYLHTYQQYLRGEIDKLEARGEGQLTNKESKRLDLLRDKAADCRDYDAILKTVADQQIEIDLDDGVQENYPKFGEAVAPL